MAERDPLHRLAERLARGQSIDWEKEERAAGEQERAAIRKLRIIAAMSIVNRSLLSGARPEELSASVAHARGVLRRDPSVTPVDRSRSGSPPLPPNSRWGSIEIREHIGGGSFGDVYRARDTRLDREVALKVLRITQPDPRDEVVREARLLARVRHPNVVTVYGADQIDGRVGIWTEFLNGRTLDEILKERGLLDAREAALIGIDLCRALSAVHAAGIVHQDVKLRNVMRVEGGRVVLMDFGLGREIESHWKRRSTFAITGTPLFMAPEALAGATDARSDLYSLGVVLFGLVTGSVPVEASTLEELRQKHATGARREVRDLRPDLASGFVQVLQRFLAPDPEQRFQTAGEAERALLAVLTTASDTPTSSTPPSALSTPASALSTPTPASSLPSQPSPLSPEPSIASSPATLFASPQSSASQSPSHRLPAEVDSFVGREADLAALAGALRDGARLVTLYGPGGIGKTRLAVRYGREHLRDWPGGVWFCDLTEAKSGDDVASATGAGMGLTLGSGDPVTQTGRSIASRGACLLILDNFEQVADHAGLTLASWLAHAPDARFVVTSRVRLELPGEVVQSIEPLPIEPGMQLFADRAPRQRPVDLAGAEADSVREVVRLLEGIPLAIELSAARLRVLTPAQIVERISERFRIAATGGHGRHAALRAAIDSSWESLAPWEKAAFCQCAMFEGGFSLEAAEGVLDLTAWPRAPWIVDVLQSLVDKSLIRSWVMEATTASAHPAIRFGTFVSLQEYAREKLAEPGALENDASGPRAVAEMERRHAQWFARYGRAESTGSADLAVRHKGLEQDLDNVISACRRMAAQGDEETAFRCYRAAWSLLQLKGPLALAIDVGQHVLRSTRAPEMRSRVADLLGMAEQRSGRMGDALAHYQEALAIQREIGNRRGEGIVLGQIARLFLGDDRIDEARQFLIQGESLLQGPDYRMELGKLLCTRADLELRIGDRAAALAHLEEIEEIVANPAGRHDRELEGRVQDLRDVLG